ncbi:hypothetical protein AOZ06_29675 [Kibdelosporangium phytohabitans]|uniref:Uncharacterized protein n=2 Tax=Kibdelosporangium phytohabitans TaxID=860235 RepID=A0A0N9HTE2_9PSEU|nr:hypothetical protein AOZ06_29675 [Kibdelosporangium phytohabitans]
MAISQVFTSDPNPGGFAEWNHDTNFFKVCDRQNDGYSAEGWVYDVDTGEDIAHLVDPSHGDGCSGTAVPQGNGHRLNLRVCLLRGGNRNFTGARDIGRG